MRPARVRLVLGLSLLAPATAFAQAPVTPQVQIKVDFTTTDAPLRCLVGVAIARISQSVYKNSIPAVETAATSSQNRPSPVQTALRNGSQSAKADFVLLLPRFQSPSLLFIHSLRA